MSHSPSSFPVPHQPPAPGGYRISYGKREEVASRTTIPCFNTHVESASSETSWKTQSPECCKYCYTQQEVLAGGTTPAKTHPNPSPPTACSAPGTYRGVKIGPPSGDQFPCMPSPLTTSPASKGLRPPSLSPCLKDVFLRIIDSWDRLVR